MVCSRVSLNSESEESFNIENVVSGNYEDDREASTTDEEAATYNTEIEREVETPSRVFKNNGDTWYERNSYCPVLSFHGKISVKLNAFKLVSRYISINLIPVNLQD